MATLESLKGKYFIGEGDVEPGERVPPQHDGTVVTPLVDGKAYYAAVFAAINDLTGRPVPHVGKTYTDFVYIANWHIFERLLLPDPRRGGIELATLLARKAEAGVDVRVLVWLGSSLLAPLVRNAPEWMRTAGHAISWLPPRNATLLNIPVVAAMRMRFALRNNVLFDYNSHPFGGHHIKTVAVYNASTDTLISFCGGMDLAEHRGGEIGHEAAVDGIAGSPLDPAGTLRPPTLSDGGGGLMPAGTYYVRYVCARAGDIGSEAGSTAKASQWAKLALPALRRLRVTNLERLPGKLRQTCHVYVRYVSGSGGAIALPRLAAEIVDHGSTTTRTINSLPFVWGPEMTLWEWHDASVQLTGPAAVEIADFTRLRWNDVLAYRTLPLDLRDIDLPAVANANGQAMAMLPAPTLTHSASPGSPLGRGEYAVLYSVSAADPGGPSYFAVAAPALITTPASGRIRVGGIAPTIPQERMAAVPPTTERAVWAMRLGLHEAPVRVGAVPVGASEFTIDTDPATWQGAFPSYKPAPELPPTIERLRNPPRATGTQSAQVLRTIAEVTTTERAMWEWASQYSFSPRGEATVLAAYTKAIAAASTYVYIEDQGFGGPTLPMRLIAARVVAKPQLKVLLVTGVPDPDDAAFESVIRSNWNTSLYSNLVAKLPHNIRANVKLFLSRGVTVHSKVLLIDDEWAAIGTANAADRSFDTDTEEQVAVVDASGQVVSGLRRTLWAEHLSIKEGTPAHARLGNLTAALQMWWEPQKVPDLPELRRAKEIALPYVPGLTDA